MIYGTVAENTIIWFKLVLHQNAAKNTSATNPITHMHASSASQDTVPVHTHPAQGRWISMETVFGILVFSLPSCRSSI